MNLRDEIKYLKVDFQLTNDEVQNEKLLNGVEIILR